MKSASSNGRSPASLDRRSFLKLGTASTLAAVHLPALAASAAPLPLAIEQAFDRLSYLTPPDQFRTFVREKPAIDQFTREKQRQVGLERDTWQLEVIADPASDAKLARPLTKDAGAALNWRGLMQLAESKAVRFLHALTCTNVGDCFGMGLWEGVPLRDVLWPTGPSVNTRRVYYFGYHNDDPQQRFISSLPIGRVLEESPGELPVILCYQLNGQPLALKNGGPVRMIVPGAYGNKSVKWLQRIVVTNDYQANDTYAHWNNDVESPMKTQARFLKVPKTLKAGTRFPLLGVAQVGLSGLTKVQYAVQTADAPKAADDPYLAGLDWRDAHLAPPPKNWGGGLPDGPLPATPLQINPASGQPRTWPLRYTLVHWGVLLDNLKPGSYRLRCRTIDGNGLAQPLPRPFPRSGNNAIQEVTVMVEA